MGGGKVLPIIERQPPTRSLSDKVAPGTLWYQGVRVARTQGVRGTPFFPSEERYGAQKMYFLGKLMKVRCVLVTT